jgi:UDP-N-acetylglucosamine 4,6-dehydratase
LKSKNILITGGTGSLGNKLTEKLLLGNPNKIIIYSRDELKQAQMKKRFNNDRMRFFIGDIRDYERLNIAMRNVDYVIHAAALKRIEVGELNPIEFIKTNVIGTENALKAAINNNVERLVALSTDKACSPITLYGATKFLADKLCQTSHVYHPKHSTDQGIKISVVRYGNVAGSRGSVIPLFKELSKKSETLPVTHEEMTRFYITLDQAANMVIKALYEGQGQEIFVSKLKSFRIIDLVKALDKKYYEVGIREAEKLHEEMINQYDKYDEYDNYYIIHKDGKKTGYNYNSKDNVFLSVDEIKEIIKDI